MIGTALLALGLLATSPTGAQASGPVPIVERSFVIAIDPGHGGANHGCAGFDGEVHEKDVTLRLAHELARALASRLPHATVVLTRSGDETVTLAERVTRANVARADLMISLHANASQSRTQRGFETYVLDAGLAQREAARTIATAKAPAHEATASPKAAAAAMVQSLALSAHRARAIAFAWRVQQEQAERFPHRFDRGVKQATFDVLMGAQMPAVLFEAGFLDHPEEGAALLDAGQRGIMVDGLTEAVVDYYHQHARQR